MKFKLLLVTFFVLLLSSVSSYGQLLQWNTFGNTGTEITEPSVANDANVAAANMTFGAGITGAGNTNRFGGNNWWNTGNSVNSTLAEAIAGNDYIQFTVTPNSGYSFTPTSFVFSWDRSTSGPNSVALRSSVDGYAANLGAVTGMAAAISTGNTITITGLTNITSATTFRIYGYGGTATGGTGGFDQPASPGVVNVVLNGTTTLAGIVSAQSGNWSDTATWVGGVVPTSADNAIIVSPHRVVMDNATYRVRNLGTNTIVNTGATLATGSLTYTNNGTTTIDGTFEMNASGYADGLNLTFGTNGTLNFNTGGTYNVANTHTYWPAAAGKPKNVNIASGTTVVMASNAYRSIDFGGILSIAGALTITTNPTITVYGTLRMDTGGFINTGAMPVYGNASTLLYNTGGNYGRGFEWNAAGVGTITVTQGYPNNVQLSNNTTLNYLNTGTSGAVGSKAMAGNLVIDSGSHLNMDFNTAPHIAVGGELVVAGNITNAGTLTLGFASGDDLRLTGNLTNTGTFNGNNRAVFFNKTGTQIVTSAAGITIPYVRTAGTGTTVQLAVGTSMTISAPLGSDAVVFGNAADVIDINTTNTLTIGTDLVANTISGSGTFKGSVSSNMTLRGTGSVGTLNFTTGSQNLGTFTMNRQNGQVGCIMGTAVTINTALALTAGLVDLNNTTMTLVSTVALPAGSANSYVIADVSAGGVLRKNITAIGSYAFPVGSGGTQFTPATVNLTVGTLSGAFLGMAVENTIHPNMDAATTYLNRYWSVTSGGITTPTYTFTGTYISGVFPAGDVTGGTAGNIANQWNGTAWLNNGSGSIAGTVVITGATTLPATNHFSAGTRNAEINIRHVATDVASGSTFTNFGTVVLNGAVATVTFTIQNLGQQNLLLGTATLTGANYSTNYSFTTGSPGSVISSGSTTFTISVNPTTLGVLAGSISIVNTDPNENPYVINFECTVVCPTIAITSITPTSGPVGTVVTINASGGDLTGTTVNFGGVAATISSSSSTQLVVTVPAGALGNINVVRTATGCVTTSNYIVTNRTGSCAYSDLIMTEIYDKTTTSLGYIEVYNGTGSTINLTNYYIRRYGNNADYVAGTNNTNYNFTPSLTTINNGQVSYGKISTDADSATPNFSYTATLGAPGINGDDVLVLYNGSTIIDVYVVSTSSAGYVARRNITTLGPNPTSNPSDWTLTTPESESNLGTFGVTLATPPTVTTDPIDVNTCNSTAVFSITASPASGGPLTYQWYYNSGTTTGWTAVTASSLTGVVASNFTTNTLTLTGAIGSYDNYQFYCSVTESGACAATSDAAQLYVDSTIWNGSAWSNGPPTLSTGVVIAGTYNTTTHGSFEACSVAVNPSYTLTVTPSTFVAIQNNLFVSTSGSLLIQNNGSLVMIDDAGVVTNNGTTQVTRTTASFELYDYTYWSSPVNAANISTTFTGWRTDYSFEFNTADFSDMNTIDYYGTVISAGVPDSFDDYAPWAWSGYTGNMTNGKGYAIMGPTSLGTYPTTTNVTFSGRVNNGLIAPTVVESSNAGNTADDFNLIGNPYPSAIWANKFIIDNGAKTSGSLYFWTHVDDVSVSNPGPYLSNFISDDYAVYNLSGGTRASFTGSAVPTGYIASGQGFFVEAQGNNTLTFNNSMRSKTYDNTQFFRTAQPSAENNRIWLNLRNADGMFGQLLVGYFDDTTLDFDWAYDARVNQSNNYLSFYTLGANEKYKIQARPSFDDSDIVPIGYFSAASGEFNISIDQTEGILADESTNVYLEDLEMNIIHDLKAAPYTFTTNTGKFENRFLLRYTDGSALGNPDFDTLNNSVVVAGNNGQLTIKSYIQTLDEVTVYDVLGRQLFHQKGIGTNDFNTSNISLSQQSVIVKIKLESGTVVTKKVLL